MTPVNESVFFNEEDSLKNRSPQLAAEHSKKEAKVEYEGIEKRQSRRFRIPGATARYKIKENSEELCSVIDISRVGLKLLGKNPIEIDSELIMDISIPGERLPLTFWGQVQWSSFDEKRNKYVIGIGFNPYGEQRGQNYPGYLEKIFALEQNFLKPDQYNATRY